MSTEKRSLPFDRPDSMEPPPAYADLRESQPVARVINRDGQPAWLVTSYDAVATVLADERFGMAPPGLDLPGNDTLFQDGEPHARLRRLVAKAFTPRTISELRPGIERLADELVSAMAKAGPPADIVEGLAAAMSLVVISELLGVASDEREHFRELADTLSDSDPFASDPETIAAGAKAWEAMNVYAAGLVAKKRSKLGDDLLSGLIAVHDADDGRLSDSELTAMAATLVTAGYSTARNAISVGTIQLITQGRMASVGNNRAQVESIVEEVLRRQAGLIGEPFPRWAQEDVELAGTAIAAGDMILVRLEAAQRDPVRFVDPDRFLPGRTESHIAFGRGPHHCLGAALARVELGATFRALGEQLPDLQLVGSVDDIVWTRTGTDAGPTALHVTWRA